MKRPTIQAVYDWIDSLAPFDSQEAFDHSGLQAGHPERPVSGILLALDVTPAVIKEAEALGASLIISHHPLIFDPIDSVRLDLYVPRVLEMLMKSGLGLISAHTNLDKSPCGGGAAMLRKMKLGNIRPCDDYTLCGDFPREVTAREAQKLIGGALGTAVLRYGAGDKRIKVLAAAGGAYSEGFSAALSCGADALLTGEVRHHHAVEAAAAGLVLFEGGHFATERLMMDALAQGLQRGLDALEYHVQVDVSRQIPYLRE